MRVKEKTPTITWVFSNVYMVGAVGLEPTTNQL